MTNDETRAAAWSTLVSMLANPIVSVKSPNGGIVQCDLRKVPVTVGAQFLPGYVEKRLSDISKGSVKGNTENDVHDQRLKVVKNWYAGDLNLKGGGTADPVVVQMKEELINVYIKAGLTPADARKHVKGTAIAFLTEQANAQPEKGRAKWLEAKIAHYRGLAEATLKARGAAAAKIDAASVPL